MKDLITVVIRTINRPTLKNSINSALKEFKNIIVVADDVDLEKQKNLENLIYLRTGRKFDKYGSACINMGAYACRTPYFCLLDDDDEFFDGAGNYMTSCVSSNSGVDIWIPGLKFNNGMVLCNDQKLGVVPGNVAVPTYKTELLFKFPFYKGLEGTDHNLIDFNHVYSLYCQGAKIKWYNKILYNIRPNLQGTNGRGN